jgi:hypothetical protein
MSTQNLPYIKVYNSVNSAANTIASAGGKVTVKDGSSSGYALLDFLTSKAIAGAARTMALAERVKVMTATVGSTAAGTEHSFIISQDIDEPGGDGLAQVKVQYTAVAGDTVTDVASALKDVINANKSLKLSATSALGVVTITADAGYPLFELSNLVGNITSADVTGAADAASEASAASTANGQCTLTVGSGEGDNFQAGDTVTLAGMDAGDGDYIVASASGTSIVVFTEGATITSDSPVAGTVTYKAQEARQVGADLKDLGKAENLKYADTNPHSELLDATLYTKAEFSFFAPKGSGGFNEQSGDQRFDLELYWDQSIAAATYDALETAVDAIIAALP